MHVLAKGQKEERNFFGSISAAFSALKPAVFQAVTALCAVLSFYVIVCELLIMV